MGFLALPLDFLTFWYIEAPKGLLIYFLSLNRAFLTLFSLPLFLRTFFKPLKNEYRKGLVGFSIGMGIVVKSILIFVDLILFLLLLSIEVVIMFLFLLLPIGTILMLFLK